ncbi:MAG: hypothetical protein HC903_32085 [Methylacidiphilales bacterium]|nr:hypothetical protein [Candidatus Methylacidiphilales bacterium]NJR18337.1 hypothetical protein [Calothrix sp. CSU_2_0]
MADDYIWIVTEDTQPATNVEGARGRGGVVEKAREFIYRFKEVKLPVAQVEQKMNEFLQLVGRLFKNVDEQIGFQSNMKLDEVELMVEISGEGEVKLVAGGKAAGKGAITLKFKRVEPK